MQKEVKESGAEVGLSMGFRGRRKTNVTRSNGSEVNRWRWQPSGTTDTGMNCAPHIYSQLQYIIPDNGKIKEQWQHFIKHFTRFPKNIK